MAQPILLYYNSNFIDVEKGISTFVKAYDIKISSYGFEISNELNIWKLNKKLTLEFQPSENISEILKLVNDFKYHSILNLKSKI
jgi:hypothetical protein